MQSVTVYTTATTLDYTPTAVVTMYRAHLAIRQLVVLVDSWAGGFCRQWICEVF